jgi:hypothetical protein
MDMLKKLFSGGMGGSQDINQTISQGGTTSGEFNAGSAMNQAGLSPAVDPKQQFMKMMMMNRMGGGGGGLMGGLLMPLLLSGMLPGLPGVGGQKQGPFGGGPGLMQQTGGGGGSGGGMDIESLLKLLPFLM